MIEYAGLVIMAIISASAVVAFLILTSVLGPKHPNPTKAKPFECGKEQITPGKGRFSVHFYLIGILFIIFDVELAFLFPWAVLFRKLGFLGLIEILFFVFTVLLGYFYAIKKGVLKTI